MLIYFNLNKTSKKNKTGKFSRGIIHFTMFFFLLLIMNFCVIKQNSLAMTTLKPYAEGQCILIAESNGFEIKEILDYEESIRLMNQFPQDYNKYQQLELDRKIDESKIQYVLTKYTGDMKEIIIPGFITIIDREAFACCESIEKVEIEGNNLKIIGDSAFKLCKNLESINIPESVKKIGAYAFFGCKKLEQNPIKSNNIALGVNALQYSIPPECPDKDLKDFNLEDDLDL